MEYTEYHVTFFIEFSLVFVTDDFLCIDHSCVSGIDDRNQEVKHDDEHEDDLHEPYHPDKS